MDLLTWVKIHIILAYYGIENKNEVICRSWSEMYRQLLIDNGFDENDIYIAGKQSNNINHKWIVVNLEKYFPGNILIADGTEAPKGSMLDLFNCKAGLKTNGFLITNQIPNTIENMQSASTRISDIADPERGIFNIEDIKNQYKGLDEQLGYKYSGETIKKAENLFGTNTISDNLTTKALDKIKNISIPSNMSGLESYLYMIRLSNIMFSNDPTVNVTVSKFYSKTSQLSYEMTPVLTVTSNNETKNNLGTK